MHRLPFAENMARSKTALPPGGVDGTSRNLAVDNRRNLTNGFERLAFNRRRR
jgi:hypothetical protein